MRISTAEELEKKYDTLTTKVLEHLKRLDTNEVAIDARCQEISATCESDKYHSLVERADQLHDVLGIYDLVMSSAQLLHDTNDELDAARVQSSSVALEKSPDATTRPTLERIFKTVVEAAEHLQEAYKDNDDKLEDAICDFRQRIMLWLGATSSMSQSPSNKMFGYNVPENANLHKLLYRIFGQILSFEGRFECTPC